MALTVVELAAAMRIGDGVTALSEPENGVVSRLLGVGTALAEKHAPDAPEDIKNEATIRVAAYLYDSPFAGSGERYASAWRNSGAYSLLQPWIERQAEVV